MHEIRNYPRAEARKGGREPRQKRRSMIATDTPEKESLAGPSGLNPGIKRRKIVLSETSSSEEEEPLLSDHSSDEIVEEDLFGVPNKTFKPLERNPKVMEFVMVEFDTTPKTYYIAYRPDDQILKERDEENEFEISYLRKKSKTSSFMFPVAPDLASVKFEDIKQILEAPKKCGTTKRLNSNLLFNVIVDDLYIK